MRHVSSQVLLASPRSIVCPTAYCCHRVGVIASPPPLCPARSPMTAKSVPAGDSWLHEAKFADVHASDTRNLAAARIGDGSSAGLGCPSVSSNRVPAKTVPAGHDWLPRQVHAAKSQA